MAPHDHHRHEIEVEMSGNMSGMRSGSNHETGPTIESMSSAPGHDGGERKTWYKRFAKWLHEPMNLVVFLWLIPVILGLVLVVLLMVGALNGAIDGSNRRKKWIEDVSQVLNAFFTVGCLFTHPEVYYHFLYLVRWRPEDQAMVRSIYCSGKNPDPSDRKHLFFVVFLINLTWIGQYNRHNRPDGVVTFWMVITLIAPIAASIYVVKGPLKSNKTEEERARDAQAAAEECRLRLCSGGAVVANPQWDGGPFDCCDDTSVCLSSFFCMFCVFGRNMNRLGFGSRNMHIVTFFIAVVSPVAVMLITALKVNSDELKIAVVVSGVIFSWVGFLYGGYWRIKMRERFDLPESDFCLGKPFLTDYFLWLFCGPCSLAQEVRTADNYDIEEGHHNEMVSLPRDGNARRLESKRSFSAPPKIGPNDGLNGQNDPSFGRSSTYSKVHAMAAPQRPSM